MLTLFLIYVGDRRWDCPKQVYIQGILPPSEEIRPESDEDPSEGQATSKIIAQLFPAEVIRKRWFICFSFRLRQPMYFPARKGEMPVEASFVLK